MLQKYFTLSVTLRWSAFVVSTLFGFLSLNLSFFARINHFVLQNIEKSSL